MSNTDAIIVLPAAAPATPEETPPKAVSKYKPAPYAQPGITAQLNVAYTLITTVRDNPALQTALATRGYAPEQLQEGLRHYQAVVTAEDQQQQAYAALNAATTALNEIETRAKPAYAHDMTMARLVCKGDSASLHRLGLHEPRLTRRGEWLIQAQRFYRLLLVDEEVLRRFAGYSVSPAQIEERRQLIDQLHVTHTAHVQATSAARSTTAHRDEVLSALREWLRDLWQIARVAVKRQPELQRLLDLAAQG